MNASVGRDQAILQKFLQNNPNVSLSSLKGVPKVKKISDKDIALQKFQLKNPSIKICSPKIILKKLATPNTTNSPSQSTVISSCLRNAQEMAEVAKKKLRKKMMKEIYYNPAHPAGYGTGEKLFIAMKKKDPKTSREEVFHWLSKQRAHFLSQTRRKFERRKVLVRGVQHQFQADLMDFSAIANYNYNFKYVLTVIDCFSRKAFAKPLRSKKGFILSRALKEAFQFLGTPKKLQTDQGSEFFNQDVRKFLRERNVAHFFAKQELKAQMVERFNRTLRNKIAKYIFGENTLKFAPQLSNFLQSYNNSVHSALKKYTPNQVNKRNEAEVRTILYKEYFAKNKKLHKFEIGDKVRPIIKRDKFKKMEKQFEEDIFIITDKVESFPPTYQLKKESNNNAVKGVYYEKQLQLV